MGILSWVHNKFNGKQEKKSCDSVSTSKHNASNEDIYTEELDRWPQALLSIGTLGNKNKEDPDNCDKNDSCLSQDPTSDFTIEEFNKIQEMLKSLFTMRPKCATGTDKMDEERRNQQLNRILNCPSRFEIIRASFQKLYDEFEKNGGVNISPDMKIILSNAKDMLTNKSRSIKQKSIRYVLKKIFLGGGASVSSPNLTNPMPESRMEKVLRALLHKKIYPQSNTSISTKKYLKNKEAETRCESEIEENEPDRCKWVKTDSDFIVLDLQF